MVSWKLKLRELDEVQEQIELAINLIDDTLRLATTRPSSPTTTPSAVSLEEPGSSTVILPSTPLVVTTPTNIVASCTVTTMATPTVSPVTTTSFPSLYLPPFSGLILQ